MNVDREAFLDWLRSDPARVFQRAEGRYNNCLDCPIARFTDRFVPGGQSEWVGDFINKVDDETDYGRRPTTAARCITIVQELE